MSQDTPLRVREPVERIVDEQYIFIAEPRVPHTLFQTHEIVDVDPVRIDGDLAKSTEVTLQPVAGEETFTVEAGDLDHAFGGNNAVYINADVVDNAMDILLQFANREIDRCSVSVDNDDATVGVQDAETFGDIRAAVDIVAEGNGREPLW